MAVDGVIKRVNYEMAGKQTSNSNLSLKALDRESS